jgi:hypothetical protein
MRSLITSIIELHNYIGKKLPSQDRCDKRPTKLAPAGSSPDGRPPPALFTRYTDEESLIQGARPEGLAGRIQAHCAHPS